MTFERLEFMDKFTKFELVVYKKENIGSEW